VLLKAAVGLAAAVLAITGIGAWTGAQDYKVKVDLASAERVVPGNDVVLGGVRVGTVSSVYLAPEQADYGAVAEIKVDQRYAPLKQGTQVLIRPRGQLGEMFLELSQGGGAAIPNGGQIPVHDTAAPVDLDQLNDIFDTNTRAKIKIATLQGGQMFQGRGQDLNQVLAQLPQITGNLADTTATINTQDQQLDALQVEFDRVATMMASEDQNFRGDIGNSASLLQVTAARQQNLQDQLTYANQSLAALNAGLGGHEQDLNALLKAMPGLLDKLRAFQDSSSTSFAYIGPCTGDIVNVLAEQADATKYQHPQGSGDATGNMLRVETQQVGPEQGQLNPQGYSCGGGAQPSGVTPLPQPSLPVQLPSQLQPAIGALP